VKFYWLKLDEELERFDSPYEAGVYMAYTMSIGPEDVTFTGGIHLHLVDDAIDYQLYRGDDMGEYTGTLTGKEIMGFLEGMKLESEDRE